MKIIKHISFLFLALFLAAACHNMLDLDPLSDHNKNEFGKGDGPDAEVNTLVMGCYAGMRKPLSTEWMMTELRSDNALQGSPGSTSTTNMYLNYLDMFNLSATHPSVYEYWYDTYQNIANANNVLDSLHIMGDSLLCKQYESEALFIRSYHFFNLVRLFGPIFMPLQELTPDEAKTKNRVPVGEVYAQIAQDLKQAANNLPSEYGEQDLGRATAWSAKGLLAKVYLSIDSLEAARILLDDIITNSHHRLMSSYADVFSTSNEVNDEILFTIRFKSGSVGQGSSFANWFAASSSGDNIVNGGGSGYNCPTASLNQIYEPADTRRSVNIGKYVSGSSSRLYVSKYVSYVKTRYDAENDWPVLRYSDVLLMYAEVLARLNGPAAGMPYVNMVRKRAGATLYGSIASINDFMDLLYNERRLELAFENDRWFDLVRSGQATDLIKKHYNEELQHYSNTSYSDADREKIKDVRHWQLLLPIPQREIDTNNKEIIVQNYGY